MASLSESAWQTQLSHIIIRMQEQDFSPLIHSDVQY